MAKSKKTTETAIEPEETNFFSRFVPNRKQSVTFGILLILLGVALAVSFVSYFVNGQFDQSELNDFTDRNSEVQNWLGKFGAYLADFFIYRGFGIASFLFVRLLLLTGAYMVLDMAVSKLRKTWFWDVFAVIILSILLGFFGNQLPELGGIIGFEMNLFSQDYIGKTGTLLALLFGAVIYLIFKVKISPDKIKGAFENTKSEIREDLATPVSNGSSAYNLEEFAITENEDRQDSLLTTPNKNDFEEGEEELGEITLKTVPNVPSQFEINKEALKPTIGTASELSLDINKKPEVVVQDEKPHPDELVIERVEEEDIIEENLAAKLVSHFGEFDPTLELSNFRFPTIDLLKDYGTGGITINQEELEENKNRIVETLRNYKIDIAQIKATVGPSVTLYEIVPEAGIRISKIKSLEDDIALSLSALGIRIIAPMPGKGTIGIEVPNKNPTMVPMKGVIASAKFQEAEMELPIALGKTISNETFVVDLAKMPHLLMAGATGQGKSVGLNAVLTSLLYKKHPAEVKFVLVDPKKVELTLFNKIERHYLAKLPDAEDAIITDNSKVITTLNSLCVEMDNRYSLLKDAMVRNIKEYNEKFKQRKLNPENGHRFLPYIVLVVDEFADLIMTAGKEVETPIARLAQLARAIGIHLIIATQRPSVNVITGMIKANFEN
jgi:S-DNA-T family DNA segregation ATPase FtsK/SpoIIIE